MSDDRRQIERILRQHVATDALLGVTIAPMGDVMSTGAAQPSRSAGQDTSGRGATVPAPAPPARYDERAPRPTATPAATPPDRDDSKALFHVNEAQAVEEPIVPPPSDLSVEERQAQLDALNQQEVIGCTKCDLCKGRTQTVFGEGSANARLIFVGEGPGADEDASGRPFVGRAGQKLNEMIKAMGLAREQVFIANVVKCRPPNNRTPRPDEVDACWDYLRRQMLIIRPQAIVTLGGPATKQLLQTKTGITRVRGTWHMFRGLEPQGPAIPVMPSFHPAYLLRAYTPENRKKVWSDLQAVMKLLGL